jgi:hypothetical protein
MEKKLGIKEKKLYPERRIKFWSLPKFGSYQRQPCRFFQFAEGTSDSLAYLKGAFEIFRLRSDPKIQKGNRSNSLRIYRV